MPDGFTYPWSDQLWVPLRDRALLDAHGEGPKLRVFGRLGDGVSADEAEAELLDIGLRLAAEAPMQHEQLRAQVVPFTIGTNDIPKGGLRAIPQFYLIQAFAILLLIFPCANVGMLVLARTAARSGELAVRTALGASRTRVVLQLFVESLVPAVAAAGLGLLVLFWFESRGGRVDTNWIDVGVTPRTVVWALGLAVFSAVVAGVLPALRATGKNVRRTIQRADAGRSGVRFGGASGALVVADVALTVAILVAAAGVWGSQRGGGMGLDGSRVLAVELRVPGGPDRVEETQRELLERLALEPGVQGVAVGSSLPGMDHDSDIIEVDEAGGASHRVRVARVAPGFFEALSRPILAGRAFEVTDLGDDPSAIIVNTTFVAQVLGGRNAIGRRIRYAARRAADPGPWFEIVGVVDHLGMFGDNAQWDAGFYHPLSPGEIHPVALGIVAGEDPLAFTPRLRALAADIDPTAVIASPIALDEVYSFLTASGKTANLALALVLAIFVLISTLAIYALMSFSVAQRTREMAVRVALGASWNRVAVAVARRAAVQLAVGTVLGMVAGFVLLSILQIQFGPVPSGSPMALAISVGLVGMILIASLACVVPTRRALRIAPRDALSEAG
jgi:predicted permease